MINWKDRMKQEHGSQLGGPPVSGCPFCSKEDFLHSIRGQVGCLHCQFDRLWDYVEENRRQIERLKEE